MIHLYEIDGVLCNRVMGDPSPLELLVYRSEAGVMHRPRGSFSILTGRPKEYTADTLFWLVRNGVNFDTLYHGNTDPNDQKLYKLYVLDQLKNRGQEVIYYDSDASTVEFLTRNRIRARLVEWRMLERELGRDTSGHSPSTPNVAALSALFTGDK